MKKFVAVLLLILVVFCAWQRVELLDANQTRWSQNVGEIYGAASVGQTFVADAAGLNRIDLRLSTYVRHNTGLLIFHLRESPAAAKDLVTITAEAATVENNVYRPFRFPPMADSRGKSYYFFLEAPQAFPGNALTTWLSPDDAYPQGAMVRDGQPVPGDLTFRTYYSHTPETFLTEIWQGMSTGADFLGLGQPKVLPTTEVTVEPGSSVGQTFVALHAGLNGVEVWMGPGQSSQGEMRFHLWADPHTKEDLATAVLPLSQITTPGFYRFSFSPLRDSYHHYYYAFLEIVGEGKIQVGSGNGDIYLDGALYRAHQPMDAQMFFRLTYNNLYRALNLSRAVVDGLGLLMVTGLLYVVPGWAILVLLRSRRDWILVHHWAEGLGVAIGLSLALYTLLLLWTDVVGLHLGSLYAWLPVGSGIAILMWYYRPWHLRWSQVLALFRLWPRSGNFWPDVALVVIIVLAGTGRLLMVRGLDLPLWDDSVEHVVMVRRILESGGLFRAWEPYAPYHTLSLHFGFHADVAAWAWLTRSDAPQAVLWAGQVLNMLAVIALYPLAYRIKGAWGGVITVLVAGMLTMFPAYYTNWGRYAQMSGQVLLPIAAWWLWVILRKDKAGSLSYIPWILGAAYLVAAMVLTYYRMAFHYLAFVMAALLITFGTKRRAFNWWSWLVPIAVVIIAGLLVSPWLRNIAGQHQLAPTLSVASSQGGGAGLWKLVQTIYLEWPTPKTALVLLGTLIGIWGGEAAALPVIWLWMLVALPLLRLTPLPGVQIIQEFTIDTSLYIPQALIWGTLGRYLADKTLASNRWRAALLALTIIGIGVWRFPSLLSTIDRGFDLSTRPDIRAAKWINESLPSDAFFLINGIVYTDGVSAIAGDAGSWLPILTKRGVVIPLQYALAEQPDQPGYSEAVNDLVRQLFKTSPTTPEGHEVICRFPHPITHVYLGQRNGMVIKAMPIQPPPRPMLPAEWLLQDPAFHLIYHQDRVMIFEFNRAVCP